MFAHFHITYRTMGDLHFHLPSPIDADQNYMVLILWPRKKTMIKQDWIENLGKNIQSVGVKSVFNDSIVLNIFYILGSGDAKISKKRVVSLRNSLSIKTGK
jgi:hypothetical protein